MTGNIAARLGGVSMMMPAAVMALMMMIVAVMMAVMTERAWFHLALLQTEMERQR